MNVLSIDVGGTHIKFRSQSHEEALAFKSGKRMTPRRMVDLVKEHTGDWNFDRVSIGYPGPAVHDVPLREPFNLAKGWVKFRFRDAFNGKPVRLINDAAMQALGSYKGGRMLFLGLGTGLGSAMVVENIVQAMELAHLPWKKGKTYEEFLGLHAMERDGRKLWEKHLHQVIQDLQAALEAEYVVLGGGNAKLVHHLPKHVLLGANENAFLGGFLLWDKQHAAAQ